MQSKATTVDEYISELPKDRQGSIMPNCEGNKKNYPKI
jgi:hypothetical protein